MINTSPNSRATRSEYQSLRSVRARSRWHPHHRFLRHQPGPSQETSAEHWKQRLRLLCKALTFINRISSTVVQFAAACLVPEMWRVALGCSNVADHSSKTYEGTMILYTFDPYYLRRSMSMILYMAKC